MSNLEEDVLWLLWQHREVTSEYAVCNIVFVAAGALAIGTDADLLPAAID